MGVLLVLFDMGDLIASLKEFVWDVIGYLIPGFLFLLTLNFVILPSVGVDNDFLFDWNLFNLTYIIIVISYAMGFVLYSLTILKINVQDKLIARIIKKLGPFNESKKKHIVLLWLEKKHSEYWKHGFLKSEGLKSARDYLKKEGITNSDKLEINEIRNIMMSKNPEIDQKVYTFMFRASLFDHISTLMMITVVLALIQALLTFFEISFLKMDIQYLTLYAIFLFISGKMGDSKRMFFSKAMRIPFSNIKKHNEA